MQSANTGNSVATVQNITDARTQRYWRTADPAQRVLYHWLTGEDPPTGRPKNEQRRRPHRKTRAKRSRPSRIAA